MKITVLSPHQDDAAFSLGLSIGIWLAEGHAVEVVNCFTRSRYSPLGRERFNLGHEQEAYAMALRQNEDLLWTKTYKSPVSLTDLHLDDAPERLHCTVDEVCDTAPKVGDPAGKAVRRFLEKVVTDALVLPLGLGSHVDHLTARLAAQDGWPESLPLAFYEDLPYAARSGVTDGIEDWAAAIGADLEPCFTHDAVNIRTAVEKKRKMALCYESQIDHEVVKQISSFCKRYGGRERLWTHGSWRAAGLGAWR